MPMLNALIPVATSWLTALGSNAHDVVNPHSQGLRGLAKPAQLILPSAGETVPFRGATFVESFTFDAIPGIGISAIASLEMRDLDGDGVIRADAGFYGVYDGPNEVVSLEISFWEGQNLTAQYQIVSDSMIDYPFLYFEWTVGSDTLESWDMGSDPGIFCFGGPAVTDNPFSYVVDTERAIFGNMGFPELVPSDRVQNITQGTSFVTIQSAINAAVDGDRIEVAPDEYVEQINFLGKRIELIAVGGPDETVIDSQGPGPVVLFENDETRETVFEGFSVTGAVDDVQPGMGVYASPTVRNCIVYENEGEFGGGARVVGSPYFDRVAFVENIATQNGGGVDDDFIGGSEYVNCLFVMNTAGGNGGGLNVFASSISMTNCTVAGNTAGNAGGVAIWSPTEDPQILELLNSIVWGNTGGDIVEIGFGTLIASYSVFGGADFPNIDADPLLIDIDGDFRLEAGSPAIDAGNSLGLDPSLVIDLNGVPRIVDDPSTPDTGVGFPAIDIGAYEFQPPACPGDLDGNGSQQFFDLVIFIDLFNSLDPSADLNLDGVFNFFDISTYLNLFTAGCP